MILYPISHPTVLRLIHMPSPLAMCCARACGSPRPEIDRSCHRRERRGFYVVQQSAHVHDERTKFISRLSSEPRVVCVCVCVCTYIHTFTYTLFLPPKKPRYNNQNTLHPELIPMDHSDKPGIQDINPTLCVLSLVCALDP